jgi:histidinol-phosphate aminotransferase
MNVRIRQSVRELKPYTPGEQTRDPSLLKLNTNENPYPPSPGVQGLLSTLAVEDLSRYPDPLSTELRGFLSELHACKPENVIVGNGSDELLLLCLRAFVERRGTINYFDPSYSLYAVLAAIEDVAAIPVPLGEDFQWVVPPLTNTSLFFLTNPNSPTSILYPSDEIVRFCGSFNGVVVIDEAYVEFADTHCMHLAKGLPNVIVTRTLSKAYSLAGIRLGYAVGPADLISALYKIKDSYNVSRLTQEVGLAALRDQEYLHKITHAICSTRERIADELVTRGYTVFPSQTNFLWIQSPRLPAGDLYRYLREQKILVRHFPGKRTGDYVRVSIGNDAEMDRFLAYAP